MKLKITATLFIERDNEEIEVEVSGAYYAGCRGRRAHIMDRFAEMDDPAEFQDIAAVNVKTAETIELTEDEMERAEEELFTALKNQ